MPLPNFLYREPLSMHNCQHCANMYLDIDRRHDDSIKLNDCDQWK